MTNPIINVEEYGSSEVNKATLESLYAKAQLTDMEREILYLKFVLGWTYSQVADEIGNKYLGKTMMIPVEGTMRYRLRKILVKIREANNL
jgi:phage host-nuclease inhibitor protein Gam